jgi:hypothetical protein
LEPVKHRDNGGLLAVDRTVGYTLILAAFTIIAHVAIHNRIDIATAPSLLDVPCMADELFDAFAGLPLFTM